MIAKGRGMKVEKYLGPKGSHLYNACSAYPFCTTCNRARGYRAQNRDGYDQNLTKVRPGNEENSALPVTRAVFPSNDVCRRFTASCMIGLTSKVPKSPERSVHILARAVGPVAAPSTPLPRHPRMPPRACDQVTITKGNSFEAYLQ